MERRSTEHWASYIPDVVLTAAVVILAGSGSYIIRQAEYLGGLHGAGVGRSFLLALGWKPLLAFITLVIVVPIVVIRLLTKCHSPRRKLLRLAFPAVCLAALLIPIEIETGAPVYLQGFGQRMLARVDIEDVQQWLATEGVKYAGQQYQQDFPSELPRCLTEFHPHLILFNDATPEHDVTIEFRWYSPHGENYGLVVGPPFMEAPAEGMIRPPDSSMNEFRRPIKPGAYVFARG